VSSACTAEPSSASWRSKDIAGGERGSTDAFQRLSNRPLLSPLSVVPPASEDSSIGAADHTKGLFALVRLEECVNDIG